MSLGVLTGPLQGRLKCLCVLDDLLQVLECIGLRKNVRLQNAVVESTDELVLDVDLLEVVVAVRAGKFAVLGGGA